jgi:hypothetical protein
VEPERLGGLDVDAHTGEDSTKRDQLQVLNLTDLASVVRTQVARSGARYACIDEGYKVLMFEKDYPTFNVMRTDQQLKRIYQPFWEEQRRLAWSEIANALASIETALLGVGGLLVSVAQLRHSKDRAPSRVPNAGPVEPPLSPE